MGFPTEIPNAFPENQPVPVENALSRLLQWLWGVLCAPFRRRKRTADENPGAYAQGVPTHLPQIAPGSSAQLDFQEIEREV